LKGGTVRDRGRQGGRKGMRERGRERDRERGIPLSAFSIKINCLIKK
jgi:predicted transposase YdaD